VSDPSSTSPIPAACSRRADDVDGVARDECVALSVGSLTGDDLARVDADPDLDLDRVAELQRCAHGPERVVLVHLRHAEHGHHGVADELLDRAAVTLDRRSSRLEVPRHRGARRFRIEPLGASGRADHIAEEHRYSLPLLPWPLGLDEGCAARVAEARTLPVVGSAACADGHCCGA
jgi:hypothetical protein